MVRTRNFATVVYTESASDNWRDLLASNYVPAFISPLHDRDIQDNGELKKPHYHIMIMFDSVKTSEQAKEVFKSFGGVGCCEVLKSSRAYARYLCHLDDKDKAQYKIEDVECLCGADYESVIALTIDKYVALAEMEEFVEKYDIVSFFLLSRYATKHRSDWSRVLKDSGAVYMREYLKSRKWSKDNNCLRIVDPETGEIIE